MNAIVPISPDACLPESEQLESQITLLAGQINAANHRLLKLIARFDEISGWSCGGTVKSCAHWLNWKCGIAMGAAREKVRVAKALQELPQIDAAFAKGELSFSKVRAMTRVATRENEDYMLNIANHGTASHIEQLVRKYRSVRKPGEPQDKDSGLDSRKLTYFQDSEGNWIIHAKLPPEEGAMVVKAIEAVAQPIQEENQKQLREEQQNVSAETSSSFQNTRADALARMAEHCLATVDESAGLQVLNGGERCQLIVHIEPGGCNMDGKRWLAPEVARRMACDASLVTVEKDNNGNILNIGRRSRTVPPAIRRALSIRDKTCRVPGCCESRYVDAHHIHHWADGGETSLDNLVTLCRHHHRLLHQGVFTIQDAEIDGKRQLQFIGLDGEVMRESYFPQFKNVSAETHLAVGVLSPGVGERTCVTKWQGENCDYGMAVEGLLGRLGSNG